jgi:hypothetical protein
VRPGEEWASGAAGGRRQAQTMVAPARIECFATPRYAGPPCSRPQAANASLSREVEGLRRELAAARAAAAAAGAARDALTERLRAAEGARHEAQTQLDAAAAGGRALTPSACARGSFPARARAVQTAAARSACAPGRRRPLILPAPPHNRPAEVSDMREELRLMAARLAARDQAVQQHIQVGPRGAGRPWRQQGAQRWRRLPARASSREGAAGAAAAGISAHAAGPLPPPFPSPLPLRASRRHSLSRSAPRSRRHGPRSSSCTAATRACGTAWSQCTPRCRPTTSASRSASEAVAWRRAG